MFNVQTDAVGSPVGGHRPKTFLSFFGSGEKERATSQRDTPARTNQVCFCEIPTERNKEERGNME